MYAPHVVAQESSTHVMLHISALCVVFVPLYEQVRHLRSAPSEQDARHLHAGPLLQEGHLRTGRLTMQAHVYSMHRIDSLGLVTPVYTCVHVCVCVRIVQDAMYKYIVQVPNC